MKEYIKPKDGKRKLYFSLDMQNFITYTLEQKTTCNIIYETNKDKIDTKLNKLYNNTNLDLANFEFFLIDLKGVEKSQDNYISKIKLDRNVCVYNFLQNPKTILCFMQKIPLNQEHLINKKNEEQYQIKNDKLLEIKKKYLNDKKVENFFVNKTIFLYDYETKIYNKLKANLSEKQFTIHSKKDIIIYIQDILSITYCNTKHPLINMLQVNSGYTPPFYIVLKSEENQWLIGLKTEEKLKKWKNGFDFVLINLNFFKNDINFNIEFNNFKNEIAQKESKTINEPINIDNIINNQFRKILLYKHIKDKKILQLVENILTYKKMVLSNDYEQGKKTFNELVENLKEENKDKKSNIGKIIKKEKLKEYTDIYNTIKEITTEENKVLLKDLLIAGLFDNIFEEINKLYIDPMLFKINQEIQTKDDDNGTHTKGFIESIIAYNCLQNYKMKKMDALLEL